MAKNITIQHLYSNSTGSKPDKLELGEIAINHADRQIFIATKGGISTVGAIPKDLGELGNITNGSGDYSLVQKNSANNNEATGTTSSAFGFNTKAYGSYSHAEGYSATASGSFSHAEGAYSTASGLYSHAEGYNTNATSNYGSHAEGYRTIANNDTCPENLKNNVGAGTSHAEGVNTQATGGFGSHAEGYGGTASGRGAHVEGGYGSNVEVNIASGDASHAEGSKTTASGHHSHAQNFGTVAEGDFSHASGLSSKALDTSSHAMGRDCEASGHGSAAIGYGTVTKSNGELACGCFNDSIKPPTNTWETESIFSVGNGAHPSDSEIVRHNALEIRRNGEIYFSNTNTSETSIDKREFGSHFYTTYTKTNLQDALFKSTVLDLTKFNYFYYTEGDLTRMDHVLGAMTSYFIHIADSPIEYLPTIIYENVKMLNLNKPGSVPITQYKTIKCPLLLCYSNSIEKDSDKYGMEFYYESPFAVFNNSYASCKLRIFDDETVCLCELITKEWI